MESRNIEEIQAHADDGEDMYLLAKRLYPICRSITGDGVRKSLSILGEFVPLVIHEVPTETKVFDWEIPNEWNIRAAWIRDEAGNTVVDFNDHNLHVLNYSAPVHERVDLETLKQHVYTLPDQPDVIPYRTSYYQPQWGFCMPHQLLERLGEGTYEVMIDSTLEPGHLTYGECYIPGETNEEILFSAHICHPSLANDNLSGLVVLAWLIRYVRSIARRRYSYRFLFAPGTIGAITWLARNEDVLNRIKGGLVASLLGDGAPFHYKKTRLANAVMDKLVCKVLQDLDRPFEVLDYEPYGYDERQYGSPGINLPVGCLTKSTYGSFPEYHTSGDNLDYIRPDHLLTSLTAYLEIVKAWEWNQTYVNLNPKCEPQLGRRGLYAAIGGDPLAKEIQMAMLWVLNMSDGQNDLLDISIRSCIKIEQIWKASQLLSEHGLIATAAG